MFVIHTHLATQFVKSRIRNNHKQSLEPETMGIEHQIRRETQKMEHLSKNGTFINSHLATMNLHRLKFHLNAR